MATQSSLKSIVTISPSSGKASAMLSAVVPANAPNKNGIHIVTNMLNYLACLLDW